jgi:hypothetical protein
MKTKINIGEWLLRNAAPDHNPPHKTNGEVPSWASNRIGAIYGKGTNDRVGSKGVDK